MVKKEFLQKMLDWLGNVYEKRIDEKMVASYYFRLKHYEEDKIRKIVFKWADTNTEFPRIADIINQLPRNEENAKYRIEPYHMCNECHEQNVICIKEPVDTGNWRCRKCYTGMTNEQVRNRFIDLGRMMGDVNFKPEWVKDHGQEADRYA